MRCHLLNKLRITEHQIASNMAKTIDTHSKGTINNSLVQARMKIKMDKQTDNSLQSHKAQIHYRKKIFINY